MFKMSNTKIFVKFVCTFENGWRYIFDQNEFSGEINA